MFENRQPQIVHGALPDGNGALHLGDRQKPADQQVGQVDQADDEDARAAVCAEAKFVRWRSIPIWISLGPSNDEAVAKRVKTRLRMNFRRYGRTCCARRSSISLLIRFCANCSSSKMAWSFDIIGSLLDLLLEDFAVKPGPSNEFVMGAAFDHPAFFQHENLIGPLNGGESMGYDKGRAAGAETPERLLDQALGLRPTLDVASSRSRCVDSAGRHGQWRCAAFGRRSSDATLAMTVGPSSGR